MFMLLLYPERYNSMKSLSVQSIAKKIKSARAEKGLTQLELANLLGVPQSYIAKIEAGKTDLRSSTLLEITKLLDLEVFFVPLKDLPKIEWALADGSEISRRQIHRPLYEPDDEDDEEDNDDESDF